MKNQPIIILLAGVCCSATLLAQSVIEPQSLQNKAFSRLTAPVNVTSIENLPSENHSITVGEYLVFLRANNYNADLYLTGSQILQISNGDHNDYVMAEGANDDDFILGLTKLDVVRYDNWHDSLLENDSSTAMTTSRLDEAEQVDGINHNPVNFNNCQISINPQSPKNASKNAPSSDSDSINYESLEQANQGPAQHWTTGEEIGAFVSVLVAIVSCYYCYQHAETPQRSSYYANERTRSDSANVLLRPKI